MLRCPSCTRVVSTKSKRCPYCQADFVSDKRILPALLLCLLFGLFGVHRFYVGKWGTGFLQLLTLGGYGLWWIFDIIIIIAGGFTDKAGRGIELWT